MKTHWMVKMVRTFENCTTGDVCSWPADIALQIVEQGGAEKLAELDLATERYDVATGKVVPYVAPVRQVDEVSALRAELAATKQALAEARK